MLEIIKNDKYNVYLCDLDVGDTFSYDERDFIIIDENTGNVCSEVCRILAFCLEDYMIYSFRECELVHPIDIKCEIIEDETK